MSRGHHLLVAFLVVLAGCAGYSGGGTTTPSEHSLSVSISNEHDATYEVGVTAVPAQVEELEVAYENGSIARYEVASFDALPPTALRNATAVDATGVEEPSRTFTVGPTEGIGATIEGVPANATVVYFVGEADAAEGLRSAGVIYCSPGTENTELALRIRPDGSLHSSVICTGDS
jgi:hypothetical protein